MGGASAIDTPRTLELRRGEAAPAALANLREISAGFEALFTSTMLAELLKPVQGAGLAGEGPGASVLQGMLETHLADHVAKSGGFGIARMLEESMKPLLRAEAVPIAELRAGTARTAKGRPDEGRVEGMR